MSEQVDQIIAALREMGTDSTLPKSVRSKIDSTILVLTQSGTDPVKVSRALSELSELSENINMQSHVRMQLFNVMSLLETV